MKLWGCVCNSVYFLYEKMMALIYETGYYFQVCLSVCLLKIWRSICLSVVSFLFYIDEFNNLFFLSFFLSVFFVPSFFFAFSSYFFLSVFCIQFFCLLCLFLNTFLLFEVNSHDRKNMTRNWLEYDWKNLTTTNLNNWTITKKILFLWQQETLMLSLTEQWHWQTLNWSY